MSRALFDAPITPHLIHPTMQERGFVLDAGGSIATLAAPDGYAPLPMVDTLTILTPARDENRLFLPADNCLVCFVEHERHFPKTPLLWTAIEWGMESIGIAFQARITVLRTRADTNDTYIEQDDDGNECAYDLYGTLTPDPLHTMTAPNTTLMAFAWRLRVAVPHEESFSPRNSVLMPLPAPKLPTKKRRKFLFF